MTWVVKVSSAAEKHYNRLDKKARGKIKKKLLDFSEFKNPLSHKDVKALTGDLDGFYRLRIGEFRVVFSIISDRRTIAVVNIAPRGSVY
mgnify:CR=1 FL=1